MKYYRSLLVLLVFSPVINFAQDADQKDVDHWEPFRPLIGIWNGHRTGLGGDATQKVEWKFVLGDKFLLCTTTTTSGSDPHEDLGMISYDQQRKKFVYRAFFTEGFVNQYVAKISDDGKTIEFETEAIENGPPGLKAKEIIQINGDKIHQELHLASGDKPYELCVSVDMERKKK